MANQQQNSMDLEKMTIQELYQLCRDNQYKGFSVQKKKEDLILFIKKKQQEPETKQEYKTSAKRLLTCREANHKYYNKNRDKNSQKVLNRYHLKKEFLRLSSIDI